MINRKKIHCSFSLLVTAAVFWALCLAGTSSAQGRYATIDAGTTINVRTTERISATRSNGQIFHGVVDQDVIGRNGRVVIPQGSEAELIVRPVSNREVALDLDSVVVNGERYALDTSNASVTSQDRGKFGANKRTDEYVGDGAVLGAIIGAIAGGGKGAAIGTIGGAAAGAGAQVLTRGNRVDVPTESLLTFQLTQPVRAGIVDRGYQRNGIHYHQGYGNSAYEQGLRDGQTDAERNQPENMNSRRFANYRDRRDYEQGYNDGYQNRNGYDRYDNGNYRQKPGYNNPGYGNPRYNGNTRSSINIGCDKNIRWQVILDAKVYV